MTPESRLTALAQSAIAAYNAEYVAGGEPVYPSWADDVIAVLADISRMKLQVANTLQDMIKMRENACSTT